MVRLAKQLDQSAICEEIEMTIKIATPVRQVFRAAAWVFPVLGVLPLRAQAVQRKVPAPATAPTQVVQPGPTVKPPSPNTGVVQQGPQAGPPAAGVAALN